LRQHWWLRCDFQVPRRHRLVFRYTFPQLRHRWSISLGIHSSQGWKLLRCRRRSLLQGHDDGSVLPGLDLAPTPLPRNPCNAGSERQSLRDFPRLWPNWRAHLFSVGVDGGNFHNIADLPSSAVSNTRFVSASDGNLWGVSGNVVQISPGTAQSCRGSSSTVRMGATPGL